MDDIVIFGSSGFVASNFIKFYSHHFNNVFAIDKEKINKKDKKNIHFFQCDLTQQKHLENIIYKIPNNAIFVNFISRQYQDIPPYKNRQDWFNEINVRVAKKIYNLANEKSVKGLIQFSTDMVYGQQDEALICENSQTKPIGEYGISKNIMEQNLLKSYSFRKTIFRPRLISGLGRLGILSKLFFLFYHNLPVPMIGNGHNYYQMIDVDECSKALKLAIDRGIPNEIFNLGSDVKFNVYELLNNFKLSINSRSPIVRTNPNFIKKILKYLSYINIEPMYYEQIFYADRTVNLNINKAKTKLGFNPKINDLESLISAYEYWLKNRN